VSGGGAAVSTKGAALEVSDFLGRGPISLEATCIDLKGLSLTFPPLTYNDFGDPVGSPSGRRALADEKYRLFAWAPDPLLGSVFDLAGPLVGRSAPDVQRITAAWRFGFQPLEQEADFRLGGLYRLRSRYKAG